MTFVTSKSFNKRKRQEKPERPLTPPNHETHADYRGILITAYVLLRDNVGECNGTPRYILMSLT